MCKKLSDDALKLVRSKVLFVKREHEVVFLDREDRHARSPEDLRPAAGYCGTGMWEHSFSKAMRSFDVARPD